METTNNSTFKLKNVKNLIFRGEQLWSSEQWLGTTRLGKQDTKFEDPRMSFIQLNWTCWIVTTKDTYGICLNIREIVHLGVIR